MAQSRKSLASKNMILTALSRLTVGFLVRGVLAYCFLHVSCVFACLFIYRSFLESQTVGEIAYEYFQAAISMCIRCKFDTRENVVMKVSQLHTHTVLSDGSVPFAQKIYERMSIYRPEHEVRSVSSPHAILLRRINRQDTRFPII